MTLYLDEKKRSLLNWGCLLLLSLSFFFSISRVFEENRFSEWAFGDAQTMLAVRNWEKEGFAPSSFLWVPQGYASIVPLIDTPVLAHHAHGVHFQAQGKNEVRRRYTHYPSWYAVGYGVLAQWGIYDKSVYQGLAVCVSYLALFFAFHFFKGMGHLFALLFCVRYVLTPGFFGYNDSLANQPWDDFFRFFCLWCWASYLPQGEMKKGLLFFFGFFLLSLTSLDSILFVFVWAVGYFLFYSPTKSLKQIWWLPLAPVFAVVIHAAQNIHYLGVDHWWADWMSTFSQVSSQSLEDPSAVLRALGPRATSWVRTLELCFGLPFWGIATLLLSGGVLQKVFFKPPRVKWVNRHLFLFLVAGSMYTLVFPFKGLTMEYQVRQFYPFMILFYTHLIYEMFSYLNRVRVTQTHRAQLWVVLPMFIGVLFLGKLLYTDPLKYSMDVGARARIPQYQMKFAKAVNHYFPGDKLVCVLGDDVLYTLTNWARHAQAHPLIEFYMDAPVFHYKTVGELKRDLLNLEKNITSEFNVVVVYSSGFKGPLFDFLETSYPYYLMSPLGMRGEVRALSVGLVPR